MPYLSKETISQYFRTYCKRQLRLSLSPDNNTYRPERRLLQMPPAQPFRPGLEQLKQAGDMWQAEKLHDLTQTFGNAGVIGRSSILSSGQRQYHAVPLQTTLAEAVPHCFLAEVEFDVSPTFETARHIAEYRARFHLDYAAVRPDLIEVLPPLTFPLYVTPAGDVEPLSADDSRRQLRIIDIKLTAEPSPSYFAEVTYYIMVLAGWLIDYHVSQRYVVVPNGAIWHGSHDASFLTRMFHTLSSQGMIPTNSQLREALEMDLELAPYEVFALRLQHFFQEELLEVLITPSWETLEWHVDNRCQGCSYLGYPWIHAQHEQGVHANHCMPMAERQDHISRVAFIPRGASALLQSQGIRNVSALAQLPPADPVYDLHQTLRATRAIISSHAVALQTMQASIPPFSGTSAMMPRWTDLHIYLSVSFDLGSEITCVFGLKAFWLEPRPFGSSNTAERVRQAWEPLPFLVDKKDLQSERRELLSFLATINTILQTSQTLSESTTVQFYLWDTLQYDHLTKVIGRHLPAILQDQSIQHLAWLFPSEDLLPNYDLIIQKSPRSATIRKSPITIVREIVRTLVAAPIPHYYSLLNIARCYHSPQLPAGLALFHVHPLFEDALSDQIPSERAHEIWSRRTTSRTWLQQVHILEETVQKKLYALKVVTERLEVDLKLRLKQVSPPIVIGPPKQQRRLSVDGQLWHAFAKLDEALAELEIQKIRAMPPHEREARFYSARLLRRLTLREEQQELPWLDLPLLPGRHVYEMKSASSEVKFREGEFLCALSSERHSGFLDQMLVSITRGTAIEPSDEASRRTRMEEVCGVTIVRIEREKRLIVLDFRTRWTGMLNALEHAGLINLSTNIILDPTHHDYFTRKLLAALQAIGNPLVASSNSFVWQATGQVSTHTTRRSRHTPAADFLWNAFAMYTTPTERHLLPVRPVLTEYGLHLNTTQWQAWEEALKRRLFLIWGPPGTGKSRTVRAIVVGAALEAYLQQKSIRILLCASTYTAIDNVLQEVLDDVQSLIPASACEMYRIRSSTHSRNGSFLLPIDLELDKQQPSQRVLDVRTRLTQAKGITIIGATPEQVHNVLVLHNHPPQEELFDLLLIDEASQMDVAHAILALCSLATGGSVLLAGDSRQLSPIHQAEAPLGLEKMVGSIYDFCEGIHQVPAFMLNDNYRSSSTLLDFIQQAGYQAGLRSFSPDLRLHLLSPLPRVQPSTWHSSLYWTPAWATLLDPAHPVTCFVYPEGKSSQWNKFEADAIVSLISLLYNRVVNQPDNEIHPSSGVPIAPSSTLYTNQEFWERAVGVVTPHRAQQGLIINRLLHLFPEAMTPPTCIRNAVDTVERFQGQQRDIILASFALGDPDAIEQEEEFILSLNRFNVMVSRARTKFILLISRQVVDHLSSDVRTLRESRLLKIFVDSFCCEMRPLTLGCIEKGGTRFVSGFVKWRG